MKDNIGCFSSILIIILIAFIFNIITSVYNFIEANINVILILLFSTAAIVSIIFIILKVSNAQNKKDKQKEEEEQKIAFKKELDELEKKILIQVNNIISNNKIYIDKFMLIAEPKVYQLDQYGDEIRNEEALENEVEIVLDKIMNKEQVFENIETIRYWLKDYMIRHLRNYHNFNIKHKDASEIKLADFANMSGTEFEQVVSIFLESKGYLVSVTGKTGDQGADLIIEKAGRRIIVQAKCYSGGVGNKAVQEVISAVKFYNGDEGWVITNSYFTKSAEELARKCNITLIDGYRLQKFENTES